MQVHAKRKGEEEDVGKNLWRKFPYWGDHDSVLIGEFLDGPSLMGKLLKN
jgi:hypothetical protein